MRIILAAAAVGLALTATAASAETIFEVESARANARAGGPTNARDAELLDRWGALSGTPRSRSQSYSRDVRDEYDDPPRRRYRYRDR